MLPSGSARFPEGAHPLTLVAKFPGVWTAVTSTVDSAGPLQALKACWQPASLRNQALQSWRNVLFNSRARNCQLEAYVQPNGATLGLYTGHTKRQQCIP